MNQMKTSTVLTFILALLCTSQVLASGEGMDFRPSEDQDHQRNYQSPARAPSTVRPQTVYKNPNLADEIEIQMQHCREVMTAILSRKGYSSSALQEHFIKACEEIRMSTSTFDEAYNNNELFTLRISQRLRCIYGVSLNLPHNQSTFWENDSEFNTHTLAANDVVYIFQVANNPDFSTEQLLEQRRRERRGGADPTPPQRITPPVQRQTHPIIAIFDERRKVCYNQYPLPR